MTCGIKGKLGIERIIYCIISWCILPNELPTSYNTVQFTDYFLWLICRRQKEKRINPPSAAMGSPTICSVAGPNPSSMFASLANSLAGGSLSAIGNPISLVTSSAHSFVGAGGPPSGPQAPVLKTEWLFPSGPWWSTSELLQGLPTTEHSTYVCWSAQLYQTLIPRSHIHSQQTLEHFMKWGWDYIHDR